MITNGNSVTINYTGRVKDGQVFDTTEGRDPQTVVLGETNLLPGFESALIGRQTGDKFTVTLEPEMAFGHFNPEKVVEIDKQHMPGEVEEGQVLVARSEEDEHRVIVKEIKENTVVLDGNHPLAGMDIIFDVEIVGVE